MTFGKPPYTVTAHYCFVNGIFYCWEAEKSQVRGTNILQTDMISPASLLKPSPCAFRAPWLNGPPCFRLWLHLPPKGCWGKFVACWCEISTSSKLCSSTWLSLGGPTLSCAWMFRLGMVYKLRTTVDHDCNPRYHPNHHPNSNKLIAIVARYIILYHNYILVIHNSPL